MRWWQGATIAAAGLLAAARPPAERVVTGDDMVAASVNGAFLRLRIDPEALAMPFVTDAVAARAHLHAGKLLAFGYAFRFGPTLVTGPTAVGRLALEGAGIKRRIAWNARPWADGVDGVIGPGGLPEPVVRFQLRAPGPGERTAALPMVDDGGIFGTWGVSYAAVDLGGTPVRVRFAPHRAASSASAGAGQRLAQVLGGRFAGPVAPLEVAFGISRPVRPMRLGTPLMVGPLAVSALAVRVPDDGQLAGVRDGAAPGPSDPDEAPGDVVVTARGGRKRARADRIVLGADVLGRCSSITFDKPARQVRLSCAG